MRIHRFVVTVIVFSTMARATHAQGSTFLGRVLTDSGVAIAGAEVVVNGPQLMQRTNASGEFRFAALPAGRHIVGARMPGYAPRIDTIEVADAGEIRLDFRLTRIEATLPEVPVTASLLDRSKLLEFHERRSMGIGRFLDSAEFANARGTRTSDRLLKLPGVRVERGRFTEGFITNTRQRSSGEPGLNRFCRAMVWLDGLKVGVDFNVNQLDPSIIAAVEWYAGQASVPMKFNVPARPDQPYCGVLVIWTR